MYISNIASTILMQIDETSFRFLNELSMYKSHSKQ